MTDYIKAITYNHPERIPVKVSLLPAAWGKYGKNLQRLCLRRKTQKVIKNGPLRRTVFVCENVPSAL